MYYRFSHWLDVRFSFLLFFRDINLDNFFLFVFLSHLDVYCQSCRIIIRISLSISSFRLVVHSLRNIPLSLSIICQCMLSLYQKTLSVCKPHITFCSCFLSIYFSLFYLSSSCISFCPCIYIRLSLSLNCLFLCFMSFSFCSVCLYLFLWERLYVPWDNEWVSPFGNILLR